MGIKYKVDGKYVNQSQNIGEAVKTTKPDEIKMSQEMTERLWEVINENTELKQKLYFAEHRLEQIRRLLKED